MSGLPLASASTALGQLQRGRGAGWLVAAEKRADDFLQHCLNVDPRYDSQVECRAEYYATLAIELGLPARLLSLDAITDEHTRYLRIDVLAIMAKRGDANAVEVLWDHLDGGHGSEQIARHLFDLDRDINRLEDVIAANVSGEELDRMVYWNKQFPWEHWAKRHLHIAEAGNRVANWEKKPDPPDSRAALDEILSMNVSPVPADLLDRFVNSETPEELNLLRQAAVGSDRTARYFALAVLGARNDPCALELAEKTFAADISGRDRATLFRYIRSLDGNYTLPLARRWLGVEDSRDGVAAKLMALHSEPEDVPAIRAAFLRQWSETDCSYPLCDLVEALGRHPAQGPYEELRLTFNNVVYSYARGKAAASMARVDSRFQDLFATECLWDCEPETQVVGLKATTLQVPLAAARVRELALNGVVDDDDVKQVATARLVSN